MDTVGRSFLCYLTLILCVTGCNRLDPQAKSSDEIATPELITVKLQKAERKSVRSTTSQPATVHPFYQAAIQAKVAGYLQDLKVDIGAKVKANDILGIIAVPELDKRKSRQMALIKKYEAEELQAKADIKVAEANINAAKAQLASAKADLDKTVAKLTADESEYNRVVQLVKDRSVAQKLEDEALKRLDSARAEKASADANLVSVQEQVEVALARLDVAKANLSASAAKTLVAQEELAEIEATLTYATLRAPFDGIVVARNVDPGDFVSNQESSSGNRAPLFVVANIDKLRVRVAVPERDAPRVKVGASATVALLTRNGQPIQAKVSRISQMLDSDTRTMLAEIDLANDKKELLPGMFGKAEINLEERPNSLMLPAQTVRFDESGKSFVYVVGSENTIAKVPVRVGLDNGEFIEITEGLKGDERIVAPSARRFRDGQKVNISE